MQLDVQDAEERVSAIRPISKTTETTTNAISFAGAAASQLDIINSTYLEPLSIFNTIVDSIAKVCLPLADIHI